MNSRLTPVILLLTITILVSCERTETTTTTTAGSETTGTTSATAASATSVTSAAPQEIKDNLQTPESVYYDADQDVYFISNINGQPLAADGNGYISRVNAETMQVEAKWIEGGRNNVTLNAPKGMAVIGDELYVSDLNTVRRFDRKSGAPKGDVPIAGSTFLNDLASDGTAVYVSDSGLKAGKGGNFEPTHTDAIWKISAGKAQKIASGDSLNKPNGLEVVDGKLWVVSFGGNELYQIDNGKKARVVMLPKGSLDGLVHLADGSLLISSWEGNSVYRGPAAGPFNAVVENVDSPADMGYDTKRHRLLIPHFKESRVTVHSIQ